MPDFQLWTGRWGLLSCAKSSGAGKWELVVRTSLGVSWFFLDYSWSWRGFAVYFSFSSNNYQSNSKHWLGTLKIARADTWKSTYISSNNYVFQGGVASDQIGLVYWAWWFASGVLKIYRRRHQGWSHKTGGAVPGTQLTINIKWSYRKSEFRKPDLVKTARPWNHSKYPEKEIE